MAQSFESLIAHTPGVDVFMPSTAADAAGLLNAAFASGRPTLFFYPKAVLNSAQTTTSPDVHRHFVPIGKAHIVRSGRDITLVGWGNTVAFCLKSAEALEEVGIQAEVLDLRSLSPWDESAILRSVEKTGRLVVVHEDNSTCGMGAEVLATVAEKARVHVRSKRVTRPDTYVPCNFSNQLEILPSFRRTLAAAAELLNLELTWEEPPQSIDYLFIVEAIGSGASDESVQILKLHARVGNSVQIGQVLAEVEASKSSFEMVSPVEGVIDMVLVVEGGTVDVGKPFLMIRTHSGSNYRKPITREPACKPQLRRRLHDPASLLHNEFVNGFHRRAVAVGIAAVAAVTGSRVVTNEELLKYHPGRSSADLIRRTGIESRRWVDESENVLSLAVRACKSVLNKRLGLPDVDMIVTCTISPETISPSLACRVLAELTLETPINIPAYDINAACSGYLYALQIAYDFLQSKPRGRVLVVTSEVMSRRLNQRDFNTAFLFGDAASATLVVGESHIEEAVMRLHPPELSAKGDACEALLVPLTTDQGYIAMKGTQVYSEAIRSMLIMLTKACERVGISVDQLAQVIPHQANQRILDALSQRIRPPVYSNIRLLGNTSSTSIPLALIDVLPRMRWKEYLGLCAFGGGFTFGGCVLERTQSALQ